MEFLDYRPNPTVLTSLPRVDFVAIIGPTGVGKTTLLDGAMTDSPSVRRVVVTTSRPPRPGEQNGIDYHFRSETEMRERIARGEYVQVAPKVLSDIYATAPEDYSAEGVSAMAVIADAMPIFLRLPFKRLRQIFILPPSWDVWQTRITSRNFTNEQIAKRLAEAQTSLEYAATQSGLDFIINDELERAIDSMTRFVTQDIAVVPRAEGQKLAIQLLDRLKTNKG